MTILNACMKLDFFVAKNIPLKHYENSNNKTISQHVPGSAKSRIYMQEKVQKRGFLKKPLRELKKNMF